ncbi:protein of unknown function [Burkholderia multivorans]
MSAPFPTHREFGHTAPSARWLCAALPRALLRREGRDVTDLLRFPESGALRGKSSSAAIAEKSGGHARQEKSR